MLLGCILSATGIAGAQNADSTTIVCDTTVQWDEISFCMPGYTGMVQSSDLEQLQESIQQLEGSSNTVLAYYLTDSVYAHIDLHQILGYDQYAIVFAIDAIKGLPVGPYELEYFFEAIQAAFDKQTWSDIAETLEEEYDMMSFATPVVVENYSPQENVRTCVLLMDMEVQKSGINSKVTVCAAMDVINVKNRALIMAYYEQYEGKKTIKETKAVNDVLVEKFVNANK